MLFTVFFNCIYNILDDLADFGTFLHYIFKKKYLYERHLNAIWTPIWAPNISELNAEWTPTLSLHSGTRLDLTPKVSKNLWWKNRAFPILIDQLGYREYKNVLILKEEDLI